MTITIQNNYYEHIIKQYLTNISPYKRKLKPQLLKLLNANNDRIDDYENDLSCIKKLHEFLDYPIIKNSPFAQKDKIKEGKEELINKLNNLDCNIDIIKYIVKMYDTFYKRVELNLFNDY